MSPSVFWILSNVCQYLTLYRLLILYHYVIFCLLQLFHCLSVPHHIQSVGSVPLCPLLLSTLDPIFVSTSHNNVHLFCFTMSTAVFYSLSTVCQYVTLYLLCFSVTVFTAAFYSLSTVSQYLTLYRLLDLCRYFYCCLLQSVDCLILSHTLRVVYF
jgi:hypothetical protein